MAPLRARLEESLHKISDKLKPTKRRISEEGESGGQHSKQARTTPPSQDNTLREEFDHTFPRLQSPFRADSGGQPQPLIDLTSNAPVDTLTTKASSSTSGVSSSNPIDLTSSSPPSTPPSQRDTMEPTTPSNSQVLLDARLAMALQDEWNRETLDADRPSSHPDASHLKVDTNAMFGLVGFTSTAARYRDHLSRLRCTKCRAAISLDWGKLVSRTKNAVKTEGFLHSFLQCASCKMWSCAGIGCCMYQQTSPSGPGLKVSWCCDGGREFLVFALCCGPEAPRRPSITGSIPTLARCRTRLKVKSESSVPTQDTEEQPGNSAMGSVPAKSSKLQKNRAPKYTSQLSKGTGYGGSEGSHLPFNMLSSKAKTPPLSEDPELGLYFTALSLVLPSKDRERPTAFDLGPQAPLKFMISRSPVFFKALQLLRQSCMEELASEQSFNLYSQVLDFAIALTKHADLLTLLYVEAVLYPPQEHLGPLAFAPAGSQVSASSSNAEEKTKSMDSLLQNLARQCEIFVQKASTHLNEFMSPEDQAMLSRAEKVIVAANSVAALRSVVDDFPPDPDPEAAEPDPGSSSRIITRSRSAKQALNAELEKATSQSTMFHRENCALELPDEKILEGHHFAIQARAIETLTVKPARGRMKKLVTQVVSLSENLPYGIYVRYGASRMDVMKVLIVGPMDTPYQDGLFEFDLFCGADFPAKPPEMYFRTTGMGTVGFNPNLYNNGKVCLSLLGTWSGQAWEPNRSTILQVLVSIQGMILNSQPWYNEPGREYHLDDSASRSYNKTIWQFTVRHAMIYWLNERLHQPDAKGKAPETISISARPATPASPASVTPFVDVEKQKGLQPKVNPWPKGSPLQKLSFAVKEQMLSKTAAKSTGPDMELLQHPLMPPAGPLPGFKPSKTYPYGQHISDETAEHFFNTMQKAMQMQRTHGNTAVDNNDDYTWGLVVRSHFTLRGPLILKHARQSPYATEAKTLRDLQQALEKHGFCEPV